MKEITLYYFNQKVLVKKPDIYDDGCLCFADKEIAEWALSELESESDTLHELVVKYDGIVEFDKVYLTREEWFFDEMETLYWMRESIKVIQTYNSINNFKEKLELLRKYIAAFHPNELVSTFPEKNYGYKYEDYFQLLLPCYNDLIRIQDEISNKNKQ